MDPKETLRILREAGGDPARLRLATVDLLLAGSGEQERLDVRRAFEVAAVPHWCDEQVLIALLDGITPADARALTARLRALALVEPFPARGADAWNVHEAARRDLRASLRASDPDRFRAISTRAKDYFARFDTSHARVEALYHLFGAAPDDAADRCEALTAEWQRAGSYEPLLVLGVMLDELLREGIACDLVRSVVLFCLVRMRYHHQPRKTSAETVDQILEVFTRLGDERRVALASVLAGDLAQDMGRLTAARDRYFAAAGIRARCAAERPADAERQRDLSIAHERIGNVLRKLEDFDGALEAYNADLAIARRLAAEHPGVPGLQRDLSVSLNNVGDILRDHGDLDGALREYRNAYAIRERLAAGEPANPTWQRDVSFAHERIGDVLRARGDIETALAEYRASQAAALRLAALDPSNRQWQLDVAVAHTKIGDALSRLNNPAEAEREYRASCVIAERLVGEDPLNVDWQHQLAVSFERIGSARVEQNDLDGGKSQYHVSRLIREQLVEQNPQWLGYQADLATTHGLIADVLREQGQTAAALDQYRLALERLQALVATHKTRVEWRTELSRIEKQMALLLAASDERQQPVTDRVGS